jgi:hypothetical protein
MEKNQLIANLKTMRKDCQAFVHRDECEFDDPWDVHDVHNWEAFVEIINDAIAYIGEKH